ncbi:glutamine synthetase family protein [Candidatus Micrarchaeota archaeon]|nr:glutamine synthetase family protein [Candidatus Micrarchaeota archaeon]
MPSVEEAMNFMNSNEIKWVDLQFVNINGELQHKSVPVRSFDESSFENGIQTNLDDLFGPTASSISIFPDQDTFARVPWEVASMRFISGMYSMPEKERYAKDSRYCIERLNINAKAMGVGEVKLASDCEFYIFDNVTVDKTTPERGPNFLIDTREAYWNPSPFFNYKNGAYLGQPHDVLHPARGQMAELLEDHFRYQVEFHTHGRSANSQQRMKFMELNAKMAADALFTLKFAVRNVSFISNSVSTFMPLPIGNEKGSSLIISQKLQKGTDNIFYERSESNMNLSQNALYYIGGLLEHAEALSVFTAPTTNSYKRMRNDPRYICWGKSPQALVPISPAMSKDQRSIAYVADPSVNPYIAYTAVVAAGLDGIKNKISPSKPVDEDLSSVSTAKLRELKIKMLPSNIMEAISALESDNKFLKGFIAPELLEHYLEQRVSEHRENEKRPTAFELEKYFNR